MDGTNWGKFGDRRFAGFAVLGWGGYWPHWSVFLVCKLLNLWNSWSIFNQCQTGNCMSIFQNSLVGKRDLCIRKNSSGTF